MVRFATRCTKITFSRKLKVIFNRKFQNAGWNLGDDKTEICSAV